MIKLLYDIHENYFNIVYIKSNDNSFKYNNGVLISTSIVADDIVHTVCQSLLLSYRWLHQVQGHSVVTPIDDPYEAFKLVGLR